MKFVTRSLSLVVFMAIAVVFFASCGFNNEDNTYSVSGYIYDELGVAVEGVEVESEAGTVQTDADGKFTFTGVDKGLILKASKEGYYFPTKSLFVPGATEEANFTAYEYYTATGVVLDNQDRAVPSATVTLNSLVGSYYSVTDEQGRFSADGIAGEAEISCVSQDYLYFFPVKASITNKDITLNITKTDLTISFDFDTEDIDLDAIKITIDDKEQQIYETSSVFENVKYNSVVKIESSKYVFDKPTFVVSDFNQVETIEAKKIYYVNGRVKSGAAAISGADIYLNGTKLDKTTDSLGQFTLTDLCGENTIGVKFGTYEFETKVVTNADESQTLEFNGTKSVTFDFDFDFGTGEVSFGAHSASALGDGNYRIDNLTLGEEVVFSADGYHLAEERVVVGEQDAYSVFAQKLYDAQVSVKDDIPATILLDGEPQTDFDGTFDNLFGAHEITAQLDGYVFETYQVNCNATSVEIDYQEIYSVTIFVKSGDLTLADAVAAYTVNGEQLTANASATGEIVLSNLTGSVVVTITCEGYNLAEFEVSAAETKHINLTYDVQGVVQTVGGTRVEDVTVSAGEDSTKTDDRGVFTFTNLSGSVSVSASLKFYNFGDAQNVTKHAELSFSGTYTISGTLSGEQDDGTKISFEGYKVCLMDSTQTAQTQQTYVVKEDGKFVFENLTGVYMLYIMNAAGGIGDLNPLQYIVKGGGDNYNFDQSGFSIKGQVTTGEGHGVAGANVYAGSLSTKTDADGKYSFPLLTGETEISVELEGYNFPDKFTVSKENAEADVNFVGTFSVKGTVKVGTHELSGVEIYNGKQRLGETGADGSFSLQGFQGEVSLTFKKDGYQFESSISVDKYQTLAVNCKIIAIVKVNSGSLSVSSFNVYVNGTLSANVEGSEHTLVVSYGDVVSFEKDGYEIASQTIYEPNTYVVQSTYSVSGKVNSGDVVIDGVQVTAGEKHTTTLVDGTFVISGLSGETQLTFQKNGFEFGGTRSVLGYETDISVQCTYSVTGKVMLGTTAMSGVVVTLNGTDTTFTTAENGEFEFSGVSGKYALSFAKEGYTFESVQNRFGIEPVTVNAYFTVSGRVMTGDIGVVGAEIVVSFIGSSRQIEYYQSGVDGKFEITGLSGTVVIIIRKENYTSVEFANISDATSTLSANLKYSVSFEFDTNTTDVDIECSNGKTYNTGSSHSLTTSQEFEGEVTFTFKKAHTVFTPAYVKATGPVAFRNLGSKVVYKNVSGRIIIEGTNIPVEGITVYAGSETNTVKTDANGNFKFDTEVSGEVGIIDEGCKIIITATIKNDGAIPAASPYQMKQLDFFVYLYSKSISNLNSAASVQIYGSGEVTTSAGSIAGTQTVKSSFKRDNRGTSVKQNLNYGKPTGGIDPRVALLVAYDSSDGSYKYNKVTGDSVADNFTANYGKLQSTNDKNIFKTDYGAYPEEYSAYIINKDTIDIDKNDKPRVSISKSGDNFTIIVYLQTSSQSNYRKQIVSLSPGSDFNQFVNIKHTYTINKSGWIKSLYTDETYNITQKDVPLLGTMNVDIFSKITYTYYTDKLNIKVPDINLESVQSSLTYEGSSGLISTYKQLDVVSNLIGAGR